ncbi:MAG: peptidoglycan DD-metalloendopeptidase family protein [Desulfovibrio sp.]|jgi:murein DD-endopeptidase MepM/ murein hydrolase activator NlpD|nr:peptidoglycan DD-metalloendopeptidase family protein [Desulfovibrio sp.]
MNTPPVDPSLALQEAVTQSELLRRKMDMDALRKRLGDTASKQEKLRESCEGFEAIFLQKMWEQMRKTVPKEGYLHSKDEEMYQSLFDIELCKKMAGAGGIGLADMLYSQLSQQLENTGRTTMPGRYRNPLSVPPSEALSPRHAAALSAQAATAVTAADLYSPLPDQNHELSENEDAQAKEASARRSAVEEALYDLRNRLPPGRDGESGAAVAAWAERRALLTGGESSAAPAKTVSTLASQNAGQSEEPSAFLSGEQTPRHDISIPGGTGEASSGHGNLVPFEGAHPRTTTSSASGRAREDAGNRPGIGREQAGAEAVTREESSSRPVNPALLSWQGNGPVSIKGKPSGAFGRNKRRSGSDDVGKTPSAMPVRGLAPRESVWPMEGVVTNRFGWEDDASTGKRRWNSGIDIIAPADSPVRAVLAGRVAYAGQREGHGYTIVLEHSGGFRTYYSHLQDPQLKIGELIQHGANFAKIAAKPASSPDGENSAVLHFEMKKGEMALNPENAIRRMATASR